MRSIYAGPIELSSIRLAKWGLMRDLNQNGWVTHMRICVLGGDGYCGWATALYLSRKGHSVAIVDNFARRQWDYELGVQTLTPIRPLADRLRAWQELTGN